MKKSNYIILLLALLLSSFIATSVVLASSEEFDEFAEVFGDDEDDELDEDDDMDDDEERRGSLAPRTFAAPVTLAKHRLCQRLAASRHARRIVGASTHAPNDEDVSSVPQHLLSHMAHLPDLWR
mgnify:CR=1 FL=1